VDFRLRVIADGFPVTVFQRSLRVAEHNRWHDVTVNLAAWAGKNVTLRLETFPTRRKGRVPWAERIRTAWGAPELTSGERPPVPESPSVILILVDTLRYDYLGVDGFEGDISTNLDWLALESIRFDRAFAPAPWTKPSVASLMTGLYPQTHGVRDQGGKIMPNATDTLSRQATTFAEVFAAHGYETAAFVGNAWLAPPYGYDQGFETYVVDNDDGRLVSQAREWLAANAEHSPYFLYLHFINVHGPYRAPEQDYRTLLGSPSLGEERHLSSDDPVRARHLEATPWAHAEEKESLRAWKAKYAATVRQLDRRLGVLLNELRSSGALDRARVVFVSDHGEEFLEHGTWEHGYALCDHQLHVPLWIREPGARHAGRRVSEVTSLLDVMPTLLGASSLPVPDVVQGEDRSRWLGDEPPGKKSRRVALGSGMLHRPRAHSLHTDRYRLSWDEVSGAVELFDTLEDPGEQHDLAPSQPEIASRLRKVLGERLEQIKKAGSLETEVVPIPEALRDRLRALGYIQ